MTSPTDKAPSARHNVSFNQWLSLQRGTEHDAMARTWRTTRGRLTRQTVIDRGILAGVDSDAAGNAYDAYCMAVGLPVGRTAVVPA